MCVVLQKDTSVPEDLAARSSETLVSYHNTAWHHSNPEDDFNLSNIDSSMFSYNAHSD